MKIIGAIILLSVGSSSAAENIKDPKNLSVRSGIDDCDAYCRNSYKNPYNQATCVRVLESIGIDCSRGMDFLCEEDDVSFEASTEEIEEPKGLDVFASIDDCDEYCRNAYNSPHDQDSCKSVLQSIGVACSRDVDFLPEDVASTENTMATIKKSPIPDFENCDSYCRYFYRDTFTETYCLSVLESIGIDCSRGMDFLQEDDAAPLKVANTGIEESNGLEVLASIDDCDKYCKYAYKYPHNQATCVRVLINLGTDCSRGMDFLQVEDVASPEAAFGEIEESSGKGPHFRVSVSGSNSNLRGSTAGPFVLLSVLVVLVFSV